MRQLTFTRKHLRLVNDGSEAECVPSKVEECYLLSLIEYSFEILIIQFVIKSTSLEYNHVFRVYSSIVSPKSTHHCKREWMSGKVRKGEFHSLAQLHGLQFMCYVGNVLCSVECRVEDCYYRITSEG